MQYLSYKKEMNINDREGVNIMLDLFCKINKKIRLWSGVFIICLVLVDVVIKIIIDNYFIDAKCFFTENFGFRPFLNRDQLSIFNKDLNMNLGLGVLILFNFMVILAIVLLMLVLKKDKTLLKMVHWGLWIELSGVICSLIDKIFWHGSLDYIQCFSVIFDLKDVYLYVGAGMACIGIVASAIKEKVKNHETGE